MTSLFALFVSCELLSCASPTINSTEGRYAVIETSLGNMTIELKPESAPQTCKNFIKLSESGFYNNLIFHRVVKGHVIQSGCPLGTGDGDPGYTIKAEFNELKHVVGTVGMARDEAPDSAGSQFYICLAPRPHLDGKYTVFGNLIKGEDVLKAIGDVEVEEKWLGKIALHRPKTPIFIKKIIIKSTPE